MKNFRLALKLADTLAEWALQDARDKSNVPLIEHARRVYRRVESRGGTHEQQIAALLHDSIEDGAERLDYSSISRIFGADVADIVDALTRRTDFSYEYYIASIERTPSALLVKLCDLDDNLDEERIRPRTTLAPLALETRYRKARDMIREAMSRVVEKEDRDDELNDYHVSGEDR